MTVASPSPTCEVKDGSGSFQSTTEGVDVTPGNTVTIRLASTREVDAWSLECVTTDETSDADAITAALSIDALAKTATFTAPVAGKAYRFRSRVNGGIDRNGVARPSYETTFGIYTLINDRRVSAADETTETDSSFGWAKWHNNIIRSLPAGAGTSWSGSVPSGYGVVQVASGVQQAVQEMTWTGVRKILSVEGAIRIGNRLVPTGVASGGALYVVSGALHWFGGSGTITLLAPA